MTPIKVTEHLKHLIKGEIRYSVPLSKHTSLQIGGPADIWIEPHDTEDIRNSVLFCRKNAIPFYVIGKGTNLLVRDEGIRGAVINMHMPQLKYIVEDGRHIIVTSSTLLSELLRYAIEHSLIGVEFLSGIPGTVGGALTSNAGVRNIEKGSEWCSIGDITEEVTLLTLTGDTKLLTKNQLNFSYRRLGIEKGIILKAKFSLTKAPKKSILKGCREYLDRKKISQDLSSPSAGCVFKNPEGITESAGKLIEKCNLKGMAVGGAQISARHANYIINKGGARASDVLELMDIVKTKVMDAFGIELLPEIRIV